jgi:hypothetical protein
MPSGQHSLYSRAPSAGHGCQVAGLGRDGQPTKGRCRLMLTIILIVLVLLLLFGGFGFSRRSRRGM